MSHETRFVFPEKSILIKINSPLQQKERPQLELLRAVPEKIKHNMNIFHDLFVQSSH